MTPVNRGAAARAHHEREPIFAAVIAVGVVYNNARIALAERAGELATLRVLDGLDMVAALKARE